MSTYEGLLTRAIDFYTKTKEHLETDGGNNKDTISRMKGIIEGVKLAQSFLKLKGETPEPKPPADDLAHYVESLNNYAEYRIKYLHCDEPQHAGEIDTMDPCDLVLWAEVKGIRKAAKLIADPNDNYMGLPSWTWDEWLSHANSVNHGRESYKQDTTDPEILSERLRRRDKHIEILNDYHSEECRKLALSEDCLNDARAEIARLTGLLDEHTDLLGVADEEIADLKEQLTEAQEQLAWAAYH